LLPISFANSDIPTVSLPFSQTSNTTTRDKQTILKPSVLGKHIELVIVICAVARCGAWGGRWGRGGAECHGAIEGDRVGGVVRLGVVQIPLEDHDNTRQVVHAHLIERPLSDGLGSLLCIIQMLRHNITHLLIPKHVPDSYHGDATKIIRKKSSY
jgi:hypothetical protein